MAFLLGKHFGWGLAGIWMGPTSAAITLNICYNLLINYGFDWPLILKNSMLEKERQNRILEENRQKKQQSTEENFKAQGH